MIVTMPEPDQHKLDLVKEEVELTKDLALAKRGEQAARDSLAQCVTVVAALYEAIALYAEERRHLYLVRLNPRAYGKSIHRAMLDYRDKGRELRTARAELKIMNMKAAKSQRAIVAFQQEHKRATRALRANLKTQAKLGMIPPLPKSQQAALDELRELVSS